MAVTITPCNNTQYLELAVSAPVGAVLTYLDGVYAWVPRDPTWMGHLLTKTAVGFELLNHLGESSGRVNLGEPYSGVDTTVGCVDCAAEYKWQRAVLCIPDATNEGHFGKCGAQWQLSWCAACACFGIESISITETPLGTTTDGTLFVYDINVPVCLCDGISIDGVTLIETPVE